LNALADLATWLATQRWFAGKARRIAATRVADRVRVGPGTLYVVLVSFVDAVSEEPDRYLLALLPEPGVRDALDEPAFCRALLELALHGGEVRGERGTLVGRPARTAMPAPGAASTLRRLTGEQSNTSVVFDDRVIMKVFRRLAGGLNPDLDITRFLTEHTSFTGTPRLVGALEYHPGDAPSSTLAIAQEFVSGGRDGWAWLLERLATGDAALGPLARLGERTGALHVALATPTTDAAFGPEPITAADVATWADGVRRQVDAARRAAGDRALPPVPDLVGGLGGLVGRTKIRHHGDFHLGQTLAVQDGRDFAIIDFEGEPLRPLEERRRRHTPLRDVAGMLRSFAYAAASAARPPAERDRWETAAREAFLAAYRRAVGAASFVPAGDAAFARAVAVLEVEKAAYEIVYEANNRPGWLPIPVAGFVSAVTCLARSAGAE
jgi:predicted trehalose synthase